MSSPKPPLLESAAQSRFVREHNTDIENIATDGAIRSRFTYLVNHPKNSTLATLMLSILDSLPDENPKYVGYPCSGCQRIEYHFAFHENRPLCRGCYDLLEGGSVAASVSFDDDSHLRIVNAYLALVGRPPIIDISNVMMTAEEFYPIAMDGIQRLADEEFDGFRDDYGRDDAVSSLARSVIDEPSLLSSYSSSAPTSSTTRSTEGYTAPHTEDEQYLDDE
jgi:hypothetical protein